MFIDRLKSLRILKESNRIKMPPQKHLKSFYYFTFRNLMCKIFNLTIIYSYRILSKISVHGIFIWFAKNVIPNQNWSISNIRYEFLSSILEMKSSINTCLQYVVNLIHLERVCWMKTYNVFSHPVIKLFEIILNV